MTPAPTSLHVLIVDDEPLIRENLAEFLTQEGFRVETRPTAEAGLEAVRRERFEVVLCDIQLPGMDGLEMLARVRKLSPDTFVLLMTAFGTVESAVAAFRQGAGDYLMKPILLDEVLAKIRRLMEYRELFLENQQLRRELAHAEEPDAIVGVGPAMGRILELVRKVAPYTPSPVLILGESGTGKELIARALHRLSRPEERFLPVNCAAIPNDLLENQLFGHRRGAFTGADRDRSGIFLHAGAGTVFLDEIGELSPAMQAKLLRALEQKEVLPVGANEPVAVACRIVAATNKDLKKEVEAGTFRDDLYYRLNVLTIALPPLRERREDIPDLVEHLLARHARTLGKKIAGLTHEALAILQACPWRGNVRELDNVLQRAVILGEGPLIGPADLPPDLAPQPDDPGLVEDLGEAVRRFEKQHLTRLLRRVPDKKEAAKRLGMGLSSLYRKIADLGIEG